MTADLVVWDCLTCDAHGLGGDPARAHHDGTQHAVLAISLPLVADYAMPAPEQPPAPPQDRRVDAQGVLVGRGDGLVQRDAAALALPTSGTRRRQVFDVVTAAGLDGATFAEVEARLTGPGWSYSTIGPRMRELVRDGHVRDSRRTRRHEGGAFQVVWISTHWVEPGRKAP